MRKLLLSLTVAAAAILLGTPRAEAAAAPGIALVPAATASLRAEPVYWVWHGRHWHHRRWVARTLVRGRWVTGHYSYY